jgi:membrane-bound metal-dependent hydrolase YbcI (DUF457 family)
MDTITHGIVGALAGKAFFAGRDLPSRSITGMSSNAESDPLASAAIAACTLGAIFPDIDVFAGPIARNPLAIMEWHRNISHSLVLLPVWALLLAAATIPLARGLRWKRPSFAKLTLIYAFGLASHVFLDVITNFGTMVWSPIKYSRVAWDWLFILDLTLTALALVPQIAAWCYRVPAKFSLRAGVAWALLTAAAFGGYSLAAIAGYGFPIWVVAIVSALMAAVLWLPAIRDIGFGWRRANWCRVGFTLVCVYLGFAAAAHRKALADVKDFAASHQLQVESLAALPLPPTLTHWAGVISSPEGVWRTTFHVPGGDIESARHYSDARSDQYVQEAKKLRDVQVYLWFARFPIWQVRQQEGKTIVEISDVRFFREEPDADGSAEARPSRSLIGARRNASSFTFEVVFDTGGQVISSGFKKPES